MSLQAGQYVNQLTSYLLLAFLSVYRNFFIKKFRNSNPVFQFHGNPTDNRLAAHNI